MSTKNIETVPLKNLVLDAGTQPRTTLDQEVIAEYTERIKEALKAGEPYPFPPIEVVRTAEGKLIVWDGFHRVFGNKEAKNKDIDIRIKDGTVDDAILFSCGANAEHGLRRTQKDKRRAVSIILANPIWKDWNSSEKARAAKVSESLVRTIEKELKVEKPAKIKVKRKGKVQTVARRGTAANGKNPSPEENEKALRRVSTVIGGDSGKEFRQGVEAGALEITPRELKKLSDADDSTIKRAAPLIVVHGLKPAAAVELLDSPVTEETTVKELFLLAASNKGKLTELVKIGEKGATIAGKIQITIE